jgi:hypothetical protein
MTLVKQKPRAVPNKRKVNAEHHRKSQGYMKTYWPYIPMALILGGSYIASKHLPASLFGNNTNGSQYNSRASALIGSNSQAMLYLLYILIIGLVVWYVSRNYRKVKKTFVYGERLLARHYAIDLLLVVVIGGLYILVR